ncbi:MAG: Fic family protein [Deltaproteobacteria bacterium]|nr:Fic family protein [Deltaproteobacteria bacterium]
MKYIWHDEDWYQFSWKSDLLLPVLGKVRLCQGKLLTRVKELGLHLEHQAQAEILIEETIKTAAIEGEAFNRDSVRSSVARHLGLHYAGTARADRHIDGLVEILLEATRNYDQPLSIKRLQSWHVALFPTGFSGLRKIRVGRWRGRRPMQVVSGPIGKEKVHFEAPPRERIEKEMKHFLDWWKESLGPTEGFLRAAIAHFWFVTIHPFEDGNGRMARALTDMALAQDEKLPIRFYSFSSQIMEERDIYYATLKRCQKGEKDITPWLSWFLECLLRAMEKSERLIGKVLAKAEFWKKHGQTTINERQRKVLNRLLDSGRGGFQGGLTTRKYVSLTGVSRATGYREISDLVNKKTLRQNAGKGRNVSYDLNWTD